MYDSSMGQPMERPDDDTRQAILARVVSREVSHGAQVESQLKFTATVKHVRPTNHVLHLILSLVTLGFWLFVWPLVWIFHAVQEKTVVISVDEWGNVQRERLS